MAKLDINNYIGCIIGGAVGDALGAPTEFMSLNSIYKNYGLSGVNDYVEFKDGFGEITDDTQMLLFTAEGLLRAWHRATTRGIWGAYTQICYQSYLRWLHTQQDWYSEGAVQQTKLDGWLIKEQSLYKRRAPGNTCLSALRSGVPGTISVPLNDSKGCGGVMRIAPVGLMFNKDPKIAFEIGAELAAMTHGHPSGYLSSGALAAIISCLNNGSSIITAIEQSMIILRTYPKFEETEQAILRALELHKRKTPTYESVELLGGGWVGEEALSIGLYCVLSYENDFEKAINLAINHSGDTDSTGAITGNILGLILGETAIPKRWIEKLKQYQLIKQVAIDLHTEVKGNGHDIFDAEWDQKYSTY